MATGGTALPIAMANPPRSLLDQDSTVSSPLSEVMNSTHSDGDEFEKLDHNHADGISKPLIQDDSDSNLSDLETNDSEAETERLYDTPRRNKTQSSNIISDANNDQELTSGKSLNPFQRSPSKLQEQVRADARAESAEDDNDDLSEDPQDVDDEDKVSGAYSEPENEKETGKIHKKSLRPQRNKPQESRIVSSTTAVASHSDDSSSESRKRKRSPITGQSDVNQPSRKRGGSPAEPGDESSSLSKLMSEDLAPSNSTGHKSAEQSGDEDENDTVMRDAEDPADSVEKPTVESGRSKKSRRTNTKKRRGHEEGITEEAPEAEEMAPEESQTAEDERAEAEADEETEAAHYLQECKDRCPPQLQFH